MVPLRVSSFSENSFNAVRLPSIQKLIWEYEPAGSVLDLLSASAKKSMLQVSDINTTFQDITCNLFTFIEGE